MEISALTGTFDLMSDWCIVPITLYAIL